MFSSLFSGPTDPTAPNFHSTVKGGETQLFGPLEAKDLEWTIGSGFITETQIWYHTLADGTFLICQIIHSSVGMWYPTVQFTCKIYDPKSGDKTWKSLNVSNFVAPPPDTSSQTYDKRSCKSDQFSVIHQTTTSDPTYAESYKITANLGDDLQISLVVSRPTTIPGFKLGKGPQGGFSNFGTNVEKPDGYVIHRFWPRTICTGHIIHNGQATVADGTGMFIQAIQGMRPNLIASRWNFADFQSDAHGGVSAIQMEFTTIDAYGRKGAGSGGVTVNIGAVVVGGKLAAVTGETVWADEKDSVPAEAAVMSRAVHHELQFDAETGYNPPSLVEFTWAGPAIESTGSVKANVKVNVGTADKPNGLVEKVDVLAEIPYVLKAFVNYVAGTKPYIYQWLNPVDLVLTAPNAFIDGSGDGEKTVTVPGIMFNEATFISE